MHHEHKYNYTEIEAILTYMLRAQIEAILTYTFKKHMTNQPTTPQSQTS